MQFDRVLNRSLPPSLQKESEWSFLFLLVPQYCSTMAITHQNNTQGARACVCGCVCVCVCVCVCICKYSFDATGKSGHPSQLLLQSGKGDELRRTKCHTTPPA